MFAFEQTQEQSSQQESLIISQEPLIQRKPVGADGMTKPALQKRLQPPLKGPQHKPRPADARPQNSKAFEHALSSLQNAAAGVFHSQKHVFST